MRLVAVANQKGGCGKTTTAINLAGCLAFLDKRVLIVDLDPQGHASLGLGIAAEELETTLYDLLSPRVTSPPRIEEVVLKISPNLHLLPADLTLSALEQELSGLPGREILLRNALDPLTSTYDYVFLDCAPGLGILTFNALAAATEVIIPVEASLFSLHGLARFVETVKLAQEAFGKFYKIHALVANYDSRTRTSKRFLAEIRDYLGPLAFKAVIRRNVRLCDAVAEGRTIADFDRRANGFEDYMTCTAELIERGTRSFTMADDDLSAAEADPSEAIENVEDFESPKEEREIAEPLPAGVEIIDNTDPDYEEAEDVPEELPAIVAQADADAASAFAETMRAESSGFNTLSFPTGIQAPNEAESVTQEPDEAFAETPDDQPLNPPPDSVDQEVTHTMEETAETIIEDPVEEIPALVTQATSIETEIEINTEVEIENQTALPPDGSLRPALDPAAAHDDLRAEPQAEPAQEGGSMPRYIAEILEREGAAVHTEEVRLQLAPPAPELAVPPNVPATFQIKTPESQGEHPEVQIELQGPVNLADGTLFTLTAPSDGVVEIAGEFNDWQPEPLLLGEGKDGVWRTVKRLRQGQHRYKFVVNGEWINDPHNANTKPNPFGGTDSVVHITRA